MADGAGAGAGMSRTFSSSSVFARDASFTKSVTHMQSFRRMKMHKRLDEPGPGDYAVAGLPMPSGGRFNMSNPKSQIDWEIYRAKHLPGPGEYGIPKLPDHGGGRIGEANPKSTFDWIEYFGPQTPGPSDYGAPKLPKPTGGRFSTANPKTQLEWIEYYAAQKPSAADYVGDSSKLSRYKSAPSFSIKGKVVKGNHQTTLENAITLNHSTVNQKGPNQCRTDGACGKQANSTQRSLPAYSFGRSGIVPPQMNRRDVQRLAGLAEARRRVDKYSKYFGYTPGKGKKKGGGKGKKKGGKKKGSKLAAGSRPRTTPSQARMATEDDAGGAYSEGETSPARRRSPSKRRARRKRRTKTPKQDDWRARAAAMAEVIPAVLSVGRPVFGVPDTPAPGEYGAEGTMGETFNSKYTSAHGFSFGVE